MRGRFSAWVMVAGVLLGMSGAGMAAGGSSITEVRGRIERSMLVKGELLLSEEGTVASLQLDREEMLPTAIAGYVRATVLPWRFEPVREQGQPVRAKVPVSLRVVAKQRDDGNFEVALRGVNFIGGGKDDPRGLSCISTTPPRYPREAIDLGVGGTVYLRLRIGRDGKVMQAFAEQVNLKFVSRERDQLKFRQLFSESAIEQALKWSYRTPTEGDLAGRPYWDVWVPADYSFTDRAQPAVRGYGHWQIYVAGPIQRAPWAESAAQTWFSLDALEDGGVYMADGNGGPRLLTPLQGG